LVGYYGIIYQEPDNTAKKPVRYDDPNEFLKTYFPIYSSSGYEPYNSQTTTMLQEAHRSGVANASSVHEIERIGTDRNTGDLWIRSFLINSRVNTRGWSVDPETLPRNVLSIIGKPLVLDRGIDGSINHPIWDSHKSAEANFRAQRNKAIGVAERVFYDKETDSYYADSRITDRKVRDYINSFTDRKLPIPVSPQLVYDSTKEHPNYYKNYEFTHLAIVDKGAYGPEARVLASCNGDYTQTCRNKLQQARNNNTAAASASAGYEHLRNIPSCYGTPPISSQLNKGKAPRRLA
jgi:hypothetical protein